MNMDGKAVEFMKYKHKGFSKYMSICKVYSVKGPWKSDNTFTVL